MDETERLARVMAARYGDPDARVYRGELQRVELGYVLPKDDDPFVTLFWRRFLGAAQAVVADAKKSKL